MDKFDFAVGNCPYQIMSTNKTFYPPIYHSFMDAVYEFSNSSILITPARFLFNAGKTPETWNNKMLNDKHFKVLHYEESSENFFSNTKIKGGIAITYRNDNKEFIPIRVFVPYKELQSILKKVENKTSLTTIIYGKNKWNLEQLYTDYPEISKNIANNGKAKSLESNSFSKISIFTDLVEKDGFKIYGVLNNKRCFKYIPKKYIDTNHDNLYKYKVLVPECNGSGAFGEVLSHPFVCKPLVGYTRTFIGIGSFDTENEAENCLKYIKSKFCRACLGILKITQHSAIKTWLYVPLQDFSNNSDIDWSKSNIDRQLYKKYNLTNEEIDFIETHVKEMK